MNLKLLQPSLLAVRPAIMLNRLPVSVLHRRRSYASERPGRVKSFLYGGMLLGAASIFGGAIYVLSKDMIFKNGAYAVIDDAVEKVENNPHLVQLLGGLPLSLHGYTSGNRGRRRPAISESFTPEGARCLETSFFLQGQHATGRVSLRVVEDETGGWREDYFAVDIPGHPTQILVQPPAALKQARPDGWRPFSRFSQ